MTELAPWRFTLLGYQAGFAKPLYLLGLLLAIAVGVLGLIAAFRRRAQVRALLSDRLAGALAPGVSVLRPVVKSSLVSLGLLLFSLALAQPQCGSRSELTKRRGIDVVVALDASKSMLARDVAPSRLERAKLELMTLLDELKGDRVGLVVFAGDAFIQCPLTSDYAAAKLFLKAVDPEHMPQGGTNIGAALSISKQLLESADRGAKDRVVVLISDGEDLSGELNENLKALKEAGVRIFSVGIGSESGEPIPLYGKRGEMLGYQKDASGQTVVTRLDRAGLTRLATATDGEFFYQPRGVAMGEVVQRIDKLQKSELESRIAVRYDERFQLYAFPGLVLVLLGGLLGTSAGRGRKKP
jgi:Ca-activated chloride channel family protein